MRLQLVATSPQSSATRIIGTSSPSSSWPSACFNSGERVEDHFVEITEMIGIGKGGQRAVQTTMMSRYACYQVIKNADPAKEIVAQG